MVVIIIWGLYFWSVCPMQGCHDILAQMFCHNLFGGASSFNIWNVIIGVWLFIIMFTYKNNCCLNNGFLPSNNLTCRWIFNRWPHYCSCETKLWKSYWFSCTWIAKQNFKPWINASIKCDLPWSTTNAKDVCHQHLNVIKELPIVGFTTCGKGMGLGESFVWWPCFGFAIFFFKMSMVVNNKIIMKKDFPMNLIIQLWAKLNSFAILKKSSQNS